MSDSPGNSMSDVAIICLFSFTYKKIWMTLSDCLVRVAAFAKLNADTSLTPSHDSLKNNSVGKLDRWVSVTMK